jgi:hypothetical protein
MHENHQCREIRIERDVAENRPMRVELRLRTRGVLISPQRSKTSDGDRRPNEGDAN